MEYQVLYSPGFDKQIRKISSKDKQLFRELSKKIAQIAENPEHYKPLKGDLAGTRRVHIGPFVVIFEIKKDAIIFHYIKHHDKAY